MTGFFIAKHNKDNHAVFVYDLKNKFTRFVKVDDLEDGKFQLITFTNYNIACNYTANMMTNGIINPEDFGNILIVNCEELINKGE